MNYLLSLKQRQQSYIHIDRNGISLNEQSSMIARCHSVSLFFYILSDYDNKWYYTSAIS